MAVGTSEFVRYGGDTTCYSLHHDDDSLVTVIDAGTGLRLLAPPAPGTTVTLVLTHYHWDHIQGLSMWAPMWDGDISLRIIGPGDVAKAVSEAISPPWFPVSIADTKIDFVAAPESFRLGEIEVSTFPLNHPQGGLGYRFRFDGHSLVVATDHEVGTDADDALVRHADGAELLVHDAQYLPHEIESRRGWGHSSWEDAAHIAKQAGVGRLLMASHDPGRRDAAIDALVGETVTLFPQSAAASCADRVVIR
jgi:ribonuclease BN (tRNA processing enzyme)